MPVSYISRATYERFDRRWYSKPEFYVPAVGVLLLVIGALVYLFFLTAQLSAEAATFDLSKLEQMESASVILDRNDKIFGQIYVENRETVPYDQLPRDLVNAVVSVEDNKFYQHGGYDLGGIIRAALKNVTAGHVRQGASTITQQLARNSFQLKERTFRRKLLEIFLARRIEERFGKQKIMELYLNRIYFGGGLYGAEAASRGYFGKPAREMTLAECATLAGIIKSPNRLSPWGDKNGARDTRNVVLAKMRDLGFITAERAATTQNEPIVVGDRQNAQGQTYAVDYVRQKVIDAVGWNRAMNEGFRIHTTIDSELQHVAEESLRVSLTRAEQQPGYSHPTYADYAARFKKAKIAAPNESAPPDYLQGAVVALDNQNAGILALVGGRDFEHNQYDRALQAKRPAGTAMLPFVYAAAFEKGAYPGTAVEDSPLDNRAVMIGGTTGILGEWGPESAENRYEGAITARMALSKSKDGATVRIGMNAGVDSVIELCKNAGMRSPLRPFPATFLGSSEITLAELALAYTIFPNQGWRPTTPHILERIEEKDGTVVWQAPQSKGKQQVIKPDTAYEVHSCLVDALQKGTGRAAREQFGLKNFPAAGKTGTAYDFTDALFAGYDSAITCAVWAGFDKPQKIYRGAFGRELALPVWVDIMNASAARFPARDLPKPATVHDVEICFRSGLLATDKCVEPAEGPNGNIVERDTRYRELATKEQMPTEPCNVHGEVRTRLVRDLPNAGVPRAELAADTSQAAPVSVKAPILLADKDPYNAVKSTVKPPPVPTPEKPEEPPVARAIPVSTPTPETEELPDTSKPILRAQPVQPGERVAPTIQNGVRGQSSESVAPTTQNGVRGQPIQSVAPTTQYGVRGQSTESVAPTTQNGVRGQPVESVAPTTQNGVRGETIEVPVRRAEPVRTPVPRALEEDTTTTTTVPVRRAQPVRPGERVIIAPTPTPSEDD
ncbi:MAG: PBP1A family penicillin-binding protein [Chthoniobacterales bacterium]